MKKRGEDRREEEKEVEKRAEEKKKQCKAHLPINLFNRSCKTFPNILTRVSIAEGVNLLKSERAPTTGNT